MVSSLNSVRARIREANLYRPKHPRKALRKRLPSSLQTIKKPGDLVIDVNGRVFEINTDGSPILRSI